MTLYIHCYDDKLGQPASEVGMAYDFDSAMEWLDSYHDAMARAGHTYDCTRLIVDPVGQVSIQYRQNMLAEIDEWRVAKFKEAEADRLHNEAVARGVRAAQL